MYLYITLILAGVIGLAWGSDVAVDNARKLAKKIGVSELFIGLTITSIGSSLPEILTTIMSGIEILLHSDTASYFAQSSGVAVGNIIGSNLSQITIILGIVAVFHRLIIKKSIIFQDGVIMLGSALLLFLFCIDGLLSRFEGLLLVLVYISYIAYLFSRERHTRKINVSSRKGFSKHLFLTLFGVVIVTGSAYLVVDSAVTLARTLGVNSFLIGLLIGLGTSIPELVISLKAILKHAGGLSIGNLLGSNITDPLLSIGIGAFLTGFAVEKSTLLFDFPYWIGATLLALWFFYRNSDIDKKEAGILISVYLLFLGFKFFG